MENNKNKKSVKFQGDMLSFCDFIQVFVFTRNHHLKFITISKRKQKNQACDEMTDINNFLVHILKETHNANMKLRFLYFFQFCITCNQIWHKQRIIHDTIHDNDESLDKSQIVQHKA